MEILLNLINPSIYIKIIKQTNHSNFLYKIKYEVGFPPSTDDYVTFKVERF